MNKSFNQVKLVVFGLLAGIMLTLLYSYTLNPLNQIETDGNSSLDENKPLYWVAPMDANFKRDEPGKSPMGMDLVPVYASSATSGESGIDNEVGTITISPEVVNNLGVRTATVEFRQLESKIKTVGYIKYDEDQLVHIHPRVEGWIEKLHVKAAGDPVEKNEPLYEIYSPALVNVQEELLLAMDRKNQRLIVAAEDRLAALQLPKSVISELKKNRQIKQTITFYTPQSGVVDNLNIREGFYVKPGTTIMSIGKLDQVWVEAEVFERQSAQVKKNSPVTMSLAYLPGTVWQGTVDYVYPTLDPKTRTVKVRLRFENRNNELKPNMFAQVIIYPEANEQALVIPRESVIRSGNSDRVVLALGNGRFKSVNVQIGRFDENSIEILQGLSEGDRIVTSAQFLLDSESSKTSDFKRMHHPLIKENQIEPETASAVGTVNRIMPTHRMLNISRGPIEKWGRPASTLDFIVEQSIDMDRLNNEMKIKFVFKLEQGEFIITKIEPYHESVKDTRSGEGHD